MAAFTEKDRGLRPMHQNSQDGQMDAMKKNRREQKSSPTPPAASR
jgi:hypothetical protein